MPSGMRFIVRGRSARWGTISDADVEVEGEQVALRVALVRPEDLREVGQAEFAAVDLEPPRVAVATSLEGSRHLDRERFLPGPGSFPLRRHDPDASRVGPTPRRAAIMGR